MAFILNKDNNSITYHILICFSPYSKDASTEHAGVEVTSTLLGEISDAISFLGINQPSGCGKKSLRPDGWFIASRRSLSEKFDQLSCGYSTVGA
jgi:hypothetical protein